MAKLYPRPEQVVKAGKYGPLIIRRLTEEWIVQAAPTGPRPPASPRQLAQRARWAAARHYAKAQSDDLVSKAQYQTGIDSRCRSAYAVAIRDYMNAPEVTILDVASYRGQAGDVVRVQAIDDFAVVAVWVRLLHADGSEREAGSATQQADGTWHYAATVAGPVAPGSLAIAEAYDQPGNVGRAQVLLPVCSAPQQAAPKSRIKATTRAMRAYQSLEAPAFWYTSGWEKGRGKVVRKRQSRTRVYWVKAGFVEATYFRALEAPVVAASTRPHYQPPPDDIAPHVQRGNILGLSGRLVSLNSHFGLRVQILEVE